MRLAVTGGIAEGKSAVVGYLRDLGCRTTSADDIAKQLLREASIQKEISDQLNLKLPLDFDEMREHLASSVQFRRSLNRILHKPIIERMDDANAEVFEIPLLFEACLQWQFDRVWVVTCGPEEQKRRLSIRLGDEANVAGILATQLPTEVKIELADRVIRTNQPESTVLRIVTESLLRDKG